MSAAIGARVEVSDSPPLTVEACPNVLVPAGLVSVATSANGVYVEIDASGQPPRPGSTATDGLGKCNRPRCGPCGNCPR